MITMATLATMTKSPTLTITPDGSFQWFKNHIVHNKHGTAMYVFVYRKIDLSRERVRYYALNGKWFKTYLEYLIEREHQ